MKIPPIVVEGESSFIREMLLDYLGDDLIETIGLDERYSSVTFKPVQPTVRNQQFIEDLGKGIHLLYRGKRYVLTTQYLDI